MKKINYEKGLNFECQGSSNCCVSRGAYGYVYLSKKDINKLALFLKLNIKKFLELYCEKTDGFTHLKETNKNGNCQFLNKKKCSVYKGRPIQCRTWPFWSENMNAKVWNNELKNFCPGIGKGKKLSKIDIQKKINEDENNEIDMFEEI
jgi:Fe-S-cluster containining protein